MNLLVRDSKTTMPHNLSSSASQNAIPGNISKLQEYFNNAFLRPASTSISISFLALRDVTARRQWLDEHVFGFLQIFFHDTGNAISPRTVQGGSLVDFAQQHVVVLR
jgi:hypothetical protein